MAIEEPEFELVAQRDGYDLRRYAPTIVAETEVPHRRGDGGRAAFRRLADYIFGNNVPGERMNMTVPVTSSEAQGSADAGPASVWRFMIEREYGLDEVPEPKSEAVRIRRLPERLMAVLRYSGRANEKNYQRHLSELRALLARDDLRTLGPPISAVYNRPLTPPFLRRNEVMIEIDPASLRLP